MLLDVLNYAGIAVFAVSGAMVGVRKDFDLWGILTVGVFTGVGGGILRDLLLGIVPPTSIEHWQNITIAAAAAASAVLLHPVYSRLHRPVLSLDAVGMGVFAASGAATALDHHVGWFGATLIGITTAIGGGVIRDVLSGEVPLLLQQSDLYAVPAMLGALTVGILGSADVSQWVALTCGAVLATALRLLSLRFKWRLPTAPRRS